MKLKVTRLLFKLLSSNFVMGELINFFKKKWEHWKLVTQEKVAELIAKIIITLLLVSLLSVAFLFMNLALALYLNSILDSFYQGFLVVAGIYLLLFLIVLILKNTRWFRRMFYTIKDPATHRDTD